MVIAYKIDTSKVVYRDSDKAKKIPCYVVTYINTRREIHKEPFTINKDTGTLKSTVYGGLKDDKITPVADNYQDALQMIYMLVYKARRNRYLRSIGQLPPKDDSKMPKVYRQVGEQYSADKDIDWSREALDPRNAQRPDPNDTSKILDDDELIFNRKHPIHGERGRNFPITPIDVPDKADRDFYYGDPVAPKKPPPADVPEFAKFDEDDDGTNTVAATPPAPPPQQGRVGQKSVKIANKGPARQSAPNTFDKFDDTDKTSSKPTPQPTPTPSKASTPATTPPSAPSLSPPQGRIATKRVANKGPAKQSPAKEPTKYVMKEPLFEDSFADEFKKLNDKIMNDKKEEPKKENTKKEEPKKQAPAKYVMKEPLFPDSFAEEFKRLDNQTKWADMRKPKTLDPEQIKNYKAKLTKNAKEVEKTIKMFKSIRQKGNNTKDEPKKTPEPKKENKKYLSMSADDKEKFKKDVQDFKKNFGLKSNIKDAKLVKQFEEMEKTENKKKELEKQKEIQKAVEETNKILANYPAGGIGTAINRLKEYRKYLAKPETPKEEPKKVIEEKLLKDNGPKPAAQKKAENEILKKTAQVQQKAAEETKKKPLTAKDWLKAANDIADMQEKAEKEKAKPVENTQEEPIKRAAKNPFQISDNLAKYIKATQSSKKLIEQGIDMEEWNKKALSKATSKAKPKGNKKTKSKVKLEEIEPFTLQNILKEKAIKKRSSGYRAETTRMKKKLGKDEFDKWHAQAVEERKKAGPVKLNLKPPKRERIENAETAKVQEILEDFKRQRAEIGKRIDQETAERQKKRDEEIKAGTFKRRVKTSAVEKPPKATNARYKRKHK